MALICETPRLELRIRRRILLPANPDSLDQPFTYIIFRKNLASVHNCTNVCSSLLICYGRFFQHRRNRPGWIGGCRQAERRRTADNDLHRMTPSIIGFAEQTGQFSCILRMYHCQHLVVRLKYKIAARHVQLPFADYRHQHTSDGKV